VVAKSLTKGRLDWLIHPSEQGSWKKVATNPRRHGRWGRLVARERARRGHNAIKRTRPVSFSGSGSHAFPVLYAKVTKVECEKGSDSNFPGEKFFHDFHGKMPSAVGLPKGTKIVSPSGETIFDLKTRCIALMGIDDLWFMQKV
jgi:hypothetical protein